MTAFWTEFQQAPDSIRTTARRAHLREVAVPVEDGERASVWMTNVPALAAKYPPVAAALRAAGLTAEQHEAYRVALISAEAIANADRVRTLNRQPRPIQATGVLTKNVEFVQGHPDELKALDATGMWSTP
jgi:hypothetical protein